MPEDDCCEYGKVVVSCLLHAQFNSQASLLHPLHILHRPVAAVCSPVHAP